MVTLISIKRNPEDFHNHFPFPISHFPFKPKKIPGPRPSTGAGGVNYSISVCPVPVSARRSRVWAKSRS